jgi:hypothetical protein
MFAKLTQPVTVDLAEGPHIECDAALIAGLLGKHVLKSAAKQGRALFPGADKQAGETHQPRQHDDEAGAYRVLEFLCLH